MAQGTQLPEVDVAVAVIVREGSILAVYNPQWTSFTLPMTKRRAWQDNNSNIRAPRKEEAWLHAAARAAAEWLGTTVTGLAQLVTDLPPFQQGDRDGVWKRYQFRVFKLAVDAGVQARPGTVAQWLTVDQFLDEKREPISATARMIVGELRGRGLI